MDPFLSSLAGGILAGTFSMSGIVITDRVDRKKKRIQALTDSLSYLRAIHSEVRFLYVRFRAALGQISTRKADEPVMSFIAAEEQYFTVFQSTGAMLGRLSDQKLQGAIVGLYINAKGFLDTMRVNNEHLRNLKNIQIGTRNISPEETAKLVEDRMQMLRAYAAQVHGEHASLSKAFEETIQMLAAGEQTLLDEIKKSGG